MKEITVYAVYNADDDRELLGYFDTLLAAKTHPFNKLNCFIVKLTGMMPEPIKKPKLLAPALYHADGWVLGRILFESKKEAQKYHGDRLVIWPAIRNKDGMFEVME
jgi:hypothetical protein